MNVESILRGIFKRKKEQIEEEEQILQRGTIAQAFVRHAGWPLLLDYCAQQDEDALNALGKVDLTKPLDCQAALIEFRVTRRQLIRIQDYFHGLIEDKKRIEEARKPPEVEPQRREAVLEDVL